MFVFISGLYILFTMVIKCCVHLCGSKARAAKDVTKLSFFRIPAVKKNQAGIELEILTTQRRQKWLQQLNLQTSDLTDRRLFVCSKHFLSGIFSYYCLYMNCFYCLHSIIVR